MGYSILLSIVLYIITWASLLLYQQPGLVWLSFLIGGFSQGLFDPIATALVIRSAPANQKGSAIGDYGAAGDIGRIAITSATTVLLGIITIQTSSFLYATIAALVLCVYFFTHKHDPNVSIKQAVTVTSASLRELLKRKPYLLALSANVLDTFSSVSLFIYLPFLLAPKGIDLASAGLFTTIFFVGFFAGRIVLGRVSDKYGAAKMLILCEGVMAALIFSLIVIQAYWLIVINLFLLGIVTRGTSPITKSMVTEALGDYEIEKGLSFTSSCVRIGNVVSRSLWGFIGTLWGVQSIYIFCGCIALLTILPAYHFYLLKKSNNPDIQ